MADVRQPDFKGWWKRPNIVGSWGKGAKVSGHVSGWRILEPRRAHTRVALEGGYS